MLPSQKDEDLIELYKVAIEEYRFQVKLNNDRLLHFAVFNVGVLSAGAGLLKLDGSRLGNVLVAAIFIAGCCTSCIGAVAIRAFNRYYRRTVYKKTVYEELLGLNQIHDLPNGGHASLAIGTTESLADLHEILTRTEDWVHRPIATWTVVGGFRITLWIVAALHLLRAVAALFLAFAPKIGAR